MQIFFIDTKSKFDSFTKFRIATNNDNDRVELDSLLLDLNKKNNTIPQIEQLQTNVLNSLNYASNQKLLPSTLPEQLNIKFINISKLDILKNKIIPSPIAQLEAPKTMYVSTDLLPQNQPISNKNLIYILYNKFQNPQQVLDFVVLHELGHLVFNNSFKEMTEFNNELLKARNGIDRFKSWLKEDYKDLPLHHLTI